MHILVYKEIYKYLQSRYSPQFSKSSSWNVPYPIKS